MVFSSSIFLFLFLPAVLLLNYAVLRKKRKAQNIMLFLASMLFYAWGEPAMALVMLASIIWNWFFGLMIERAGENAPQKKLMLALAVLLNVALLFIFKYLMFTLQNLNLLLGTQIVVPIIGLPIGISFFTFQGMSYIFDVYRKKAAAQRNVLNVGLYISLFPQLVAGPIVRYDLIADQIENRQESVDCFTSGVSRFIVGLAKKVIIANKLALLADAAFADKLFASGGYGASTLMAWLGALAYALQIYFDFSGYSDMAIGLGRMFGFRFMENFDYPYIAKNMTDFWRRWHISLSSWFRDYIYIPLGGNRVSSGRWVLNMCIVWLLTGIWHGANWTFIVWGLLHLAALLIEKATGLDKKGNIFTRVYTLLVVLAGWVIFRADSLSQAWIYLKAMAGFSSAAGADSSSLMYLAQYALLLAVGVLAGTRLAKSLSERLEDKPVYGPLQTVCLLALFAASFVYIVNQSYNPFIYFNF